MTSFPPPSSTPNASATEGLPPDERLPSYTEVFVPGATKYYVILDGKYRGIYTNWAVVGPVLNLIQANHRKVYSFSDAQDALRDSDIAMAMVTAHLAGLSVDSGNQVKAPVQPEVPVNSGAHESAASSTASQPAQSNAIAGPLPAATTQTPPLLPLLQSGELIALIASSADIEEGREEYLKGRGGRPAGGGWPYLAVARGRRRGIFANSPEASALVVGYSGFLSRGFRTVGAAHLWLLDHPQ
ncbi:hypothetical protein FA95DRAFT_1613006 [Auriscalpium vulgare]|uniref:Uncharacterized protein n=1 Tax=Auriscalpium vulgare TaxID=40419 RepID=A0ACB8R5L6_9AGAM|nr:hypothetical protein FA95DRAFT_1613006 [Auriscalpium vulgare]